MQSILSIQRNSSILQPTLIIHQIKDLFATEVKWTRVLKQLSDLNLLQQNPSFEITPIGLRIPFSFEHTTQTYRFQIRIDNNFPFTKPQVHSLDKNWRYSQARDLLDYGFEEGEEWDSGMTLGDVRLLIPRIVEHIKLSEEQIGKYHLFDKYFKEELITKGLEYFNVTETKKKMLITSNKDKAICFGKQVFLKFDVSESHLVLELLLLRSQMRQVQRNQQLQQLKVFYRKAGAQKEQHFRISCGDNYKDIIFNFNPISFIEHKVAEASDDQCRSEEMVTNLSTLVSFYADKNKNKSTTYLKKLQNVISAEDIEMEEIKEESEK